MKSFDEAFSDSEYAEGARPAIEAGWNLALSALEAALLPGETLGDVKDTIKYMRTNTE